MKTTVTTPEPRSAGSLVTPEPPLHGRAMYGCVPLLLLVVLLARWAR